MVLYPAALADAPIPEINHTYDTSYLIHLLNIFSDW